MKTIIFILLSIISIDTFALVSPKVPPRIPPVRPPEEIIISSTTGAGGYPVAPQRFPYIHTTQFYIGDISMIYKNQNMCRVDRFVKYGY